MTNSRQPQTKNPTRKEQNCCSCHKKIMKRRNQRDKFISSQPLFHKKKKFGMKAVDLSVEALIHEALPCCDYANIPSFTLRFITPFEQLKKSGANKCILQNKFQKTTKKKISDSSEMQTHAGRSLLHVLVNWNVILQLPG